MRTFALFFAATAIMATTSNLFSSIRGSFSFNLPAICDLAVISSDGGTFICPYFQENALEIFRNTGHGFEGTQMVDLPNPLKNIDMTEDAETVYITCNYNLWVLKRG